ncbi:hypothetical protein FKW77_002139 [Venturia effusa]|uniref:Uncharacterized protein n=1 Tax=Venturia effusa TaxID=50376 RepID=A0A517KZ70_9PEZI|nr:hypothetical protein FKW77_002139 [Venturia effusa]
MRTSRYVFGLTSKTCGNNCIGKTGFANGLNQPFTTSIWLYARAKKSGNVKLDNPTPKRDPSIGVQQDTGSKNGLTRRPESEKSKQATAGTLKTATTSDTALVASKEPARRYAYPQRLLIWNGGVWKNAFIGLVNVASLTWMGWGLAFWAPSYMMIPELNGWYTIPGTSLLHYKNEIIKLISQ